MKSEEIFFIFDVFLAGAFSILFIIGLINGGYVGAVISLCFMLWTMYDSYIYIKKNILGEIT